MSVTVKSDLYGTHSTGKPVNRYVIENSNKMRVEIIDLGGIVTSLCVPDRHGNLEDIVTGFDSVSEYEVNPAYFGAIVGRVANRISAGRFQLDGQTYNVSLNRAPIHLHGGISGFDKKLWCGEIIDGGVKLTYLSMDGEEGYPGNLTAVVTYVLTNQNELCIHYTATSDRPTIINLTNHSYFNLAGHKSGTIGDHKLSVNADKYLEKDENQVPTGKFLDVSGTPYDLKTAALLAERLSLVGGGNPPGYDHNFCVSQQQELGEGRRGLAAAATLSHEGSGRVLEVFTDQPGIQVYTGNYLTGLKGKQGASYVQHSCIALETQNYPDSINHENFPSCVLRPGEQYEHNTTYRFSVAQ